VVIKEGRKREVRRLWEAQGVTVSRLARVRFGPLALERGLRQGRWRPLTQNEQKQLYQAAGLNAPNMAAQHRKKTSARKTKGNVRRNRGRR